MKELKPLEPWQEAMLVEIEKRAKGWVDGFIAHLRARHLDDFPVDLKDIPNLPTPIADTLHREEEG